MDVIYMHEVHKLHKRDIAQHHGLIYCSVNKIVKQYKKRNRINKLVPPSARARILSQRYMHLKSQLELKQILSSNQKETKNCIDKLSIP